MPERTEIIRRVQVGLIGLSVIVMMLFVGSAIVSRLRTDTTKPGVVMPAKPMEKSPDPAAKLGIEPANSPENAVAPNSPSGNPPNPSGLPVTNNTQPAAPHP